MTGDLLNVFWCSIGIVMGAAATVLVLRARIADIKTAERILDARRQMLDMWQKRLDEGGHG